MCELRNGVLNIVKRCSYVLQYQVSNMLKGYWEEVQC